MMPGKGPKLLSGWREMRLKLQTWEISANVCEAGAQGAE